MRYLAALCLVLISILPGTAQAVVCIPPKGSPYDLERLLPRLTAEFWMLLPFFAVVTVAVLVTYGYRRLRFAKVNASKYLRAFVFFTSLSVLAVILIGRCCIGASGGFCVPDHPRWMRELELFGWLGIYCIVGYMFYRLATLLQKFKK